jgi:hypothetical protein
LIDEEEKEEKENLAGRKAAGPYKADLGQIK